MENKLAVKSNINSQDWYKAMVEDCQAVITEAVFTSNWTLVEGYHKLGQRISEEKANFDKAGLYGQKITTQVSVSLNKSIRTIERAVQFYEKYPDLQLLPDGKNVTWHKVVNKYLPKTTTVKDKELPDNAVLEIKVKKVKDLIFKIWSLKQDAFKIRGLIKDNYWAEADRTLDNFDHWLEGLEECLKPLTKNIKLLGEEEKKAEEFIPGDYTDGSKPEGKETKFVSEAEIAQEEAENNAESGEIDNLDLRN
jgi:hypothetical protein